MRLPLFQPIVLAAAGYDAHNGNREINRFSGFNISFSK